MRINNNLMAMNAHRQLGVANSGGAKSMEKLSSGYRINRAGDDAAGLAISEKMRGQIRGLNQASRNAQDGISLIQTAEGALNETHAILQRMRELAVQSSTDTNTDDDRAEIQKEVDQLATEITRIAETTQFNTMNLLDGTYEDKVFHIGANEGQNASIAISNMRANVLGVQGATEEGEEGTASYVHTSGDITDFDFSGGTTTVSDGTNTVTLNSDLQNIDGLVGALNGQLGDIVVSADGDKLVFTGEAEFTITVSGDGAGNLGGVAGTAEVDTTPVDPGEGTEEGALTGEIKGIDVSEQDKADAAIKTIDTAINTVSSERAKLGAMQNRLEHTIKNLDTSAENLQASEARIRDIDMAAEMMEFTKQNILQQASTAMLAQANAAPQTVLQLLQ